MRPDILTKIENRNKYHILLTESELSDPVYMQAYVNAMHEDYAALLADDQTFLAGFKAQEHPPAWRGYALLGSGNYVISHTDYFDKELGAELVITLATEEDRSGNRQIGESRMTPDDSPPIQAKDIVIRIGFLSERGLFALEEQLRFIRETHFSDAAGAAPALIAAATKARNAMWEVDNGSGRFWFADAIDTLNKALAAGAAPMEPT